jgi:hypothetical protein
MTADQRDQPAICFSLDFNAEGISSTIRHRMHRLAEAPPARTNINTPRSQQVATDTARTITRYAGRPCKSSGSLAMLTAMRRGVSRFAVRLLGRSRGCSALHADDLDPILAAELLPHRGFSEVGLRVEEACDRIAKPWWVHSESAAPVTAQIRISAVSIVSP